MTHDNVVHITSEAETSTLKVGVGVGAKMCTEIDILGWGAPLPPSTSATDHTSSKLCPVLKFA